MLACNRGIGVLGVGKVPRLFSKSHRAGLLEWAEHETWDRIALVMTQRSMSSFLKAIQLSRKRLIVLYVIYPSQKPVWDSG